MDKDEKRRLKKLGKELVERQSRELQEALREANPAPSGSDEWGEGYRAGVLREKQLRAAPPDRISAAELKATFALLPVEGEGSGGLLGFPTWYYECPSCGDVLHSVPRETVRCSCGKLVVDVGTGPVLASSGERPRLVKLIGRG
jgi:hypothetical protein